MTCPRCQTENPPQAKFCLECAAPLVARCASCGTPLPASAKFCLECAHPVGGATAGPTRFASPESYTPKHLAEKILTSKAALEGERKQVTVLFADLKGSMELLADRDPEDARKLLDPVLEHMMEAVHRYEGTVNQVMGDGIMALFGAPLAHEDHAVRACYAALRMQESVKRYAEGVRREQGVTIRIRAGLNSGEVVVRAIGSDLHMDYTAVGQTTHLAARMEQLADPGASLLTSETLALAEGFVQVTSLGPIAVKGLAAPVEVYELTGISAVRSRLQAAAARGLSRFVGRDAEIEQLRRAVDQARQGRGQVASVVGEPGVGKSRLTFELTHSHRVEGWLVLQAGSVSYGKATSYLPVIDLLKNYFRIGDRDTRREIQEKVTGKILMLDRALEATLPALLALLDVSGDHPQWQALDPPQRRQRTLDAVKRLLLHEAHVQPLLVVFEDLHWIDSETQALLDGVVESLPPARLLLLVNYRPEYEHRWGSKTAYTQVRLDPLPPESALELLRGLLGEDNTIEPLSRILIERTEGNPFFLEESVRALVETKALVGERGAYRLAKGLTDIQVPPTVQAILAARIDRLLPEEKRLLQSAAVIGKDVPFALLAAIADEREEELRHALAHLQAAEFLDETSLFPDIEYTFRHGLTLEVAYGSLLQERRRALHARILEVLESAASDRLGDHSDRLAHHALRGGVWDKAVTYHHDVGVKAAQRAAWREAVSSFEQAQAALDHIPESLAKTAQVIDLRFGLASSLNVLGEYEGTLAHLREAEVLARDINDQVRLGWVLSRMVQVCRMKADYDVALAQGREGLAIAARLDNRALEVAITHRVGQVHYALGDFGQAAAQLRRNVETLESGTPDPGRYYGIASRAWLALALSTLGEFAEGVRHGAEALRLATGEATGASPVIVHGCLGLLYLTKGDLEAGVPVLERGLAQCRASGDRDWARWTAAGLGHAYALVGRVAEGRALLEETLREDLRTGASNAYAEHLVRFSVVCLLAGSPSDALESAHQALDLARQYRERGYEALALHQLGEVHAHAGPTDREAAEHHYRQALALSRELGMRPLVARCHLALGTLSRRTGNRRQAEEHLATATTMFREMEMHFWLEKAAAELAALR